MSGRRGDVVGVTVELRVTVRVMLLLGVREAVTLRVGVTLRVVLEVGVRLGLTVRLRLRLGVEVGVRLALGVPLGVVLGEGVPLGLVLGEGVIERLKLAEGVSEGVVDALGVQDTDAEGVSEPLGVRVPAAVTEALPLQLGEDDTLPLGDRLALPATEGEGVGVVAAPPPPPPPCAHTPLACSSPSSATQHSAYQALLRRWLRMREDPSTNANYVKECSRAGEAVAQAGGCWHRPKMMRRAGQAALGCP